MKHARIKIKKPEWLPEIPRVYVRLAVAFAAVTLFGTITFHIVEGWSYITSLYFTVATMTTVGYGDVCPKTVPGRVLAMILMFTGVGLASYALTSFVTDVIRGDVTMAIKESKLKRRLAKVENHVVVCGYGRTGQRVVKELVDKYDFEVVVIDIDEKAYREAIMDGHPAVHGDATEEDTLREARVHKARAMVVCTGDDRTNVFITLLADSINPDLWITSVAETVDGVKLLRKAGADCSLFIYGCVAKHVARCSVSPLAFKVTVEHTVDDIPDVMWAILSNGGIIEYVEYYTPPLRNPIRRNVHIKSYDTVMRFWKELEKNPEKKKALEMIYKIGRNVHSYGIICHDEEQMEKIIEELEELEVLVGVDMKPDEILEYIESKERT